MVPQPFAGIFAQAKPRLRRVAAVVACSLPAVGIGLPAPHGGVIATFFYACPGPGVAPAVRTTFTAAVRPAPRPRYSPVAVFPRGRNPARRYEIVGTVDVRSHSTHTSIDELRDHAIRAARGMGGDAIVDVWWDDAATLDPRKGERGMLELQASVVRWL